MKDFSERLIFIVGVPRSGTTWLWGLLTSHPDCISVDKDSLGIGTNFRKDGSRYTSESGIFLHKLSDDEVYQKFQAFVESKPEVKYFIEKTPDHTHHIDRIKKIFPTSIIICMRRNVYDIMTSMKFFFPKNSFGTLAKRMVKFIQKIEKFQMLIDKTIDYEYLNYNTELELTNLFCWLGSSLESIPRIIIKNDKKVLLVDRPDAFRKGIVGDWIKSLTPTEKQMIHNLSVPDGWKDRSYYFAKDWITTRNNFTVEELKELKEN